ncbi:MAG: sulfotransferase [Planctomycetota bacterium]|nr:sulfotransferase [Planctomycetota bacterium]
MQELEGLFLAAVEAQRAGDSSAARRRFEEILGRFPACHEAVFMLAMLDADAGELASAERRLNEALRLDPGHPEYLFRLGSLQLARGRALEAVQTLRRAEAAGEEAGEVLLALATAELQAGQVSEAETHARRAIELDGHVAQADVLMMSILGARRELGAALEHARASAARHPENAEVRARLALLLERANDLGGAVDEARAALALRKDHPTALGVVGRLLEREGKLEEAAQAFKDAVSACAPNSSEARDLCRSLGLVLDRMKRHDDAMRCFRASKRDPRSLDEEFRRASEEVGRFIDAQIRDLPEGIAATWPRTPAEERPSPVFFVGFPRSGTTLLEQMLGAHPAIVTTDELRNLGRVTETLAQPLGGLERLPRHLGSISEAEVVRARAEYWGVAEGELGAEALAGKLLLDKHPLNTPNLFTARRVFPGSKVVVSLRDPRDVVLSCFMNLSRTAAAVLHYGTLEDAARQYAQVMKLWLHMRTALDLPWLEVRYEDIVEQPEATVGRVLEFVGQPWDDAVLRFVEKTAGKQVRSTSYRQVTEGLYKRALGRWRAYEKHFGAALPILEPFAQEFGYGDA